MREILFRGKRVDNGEWVISDCFYQCSGLVKLWDAPNKDGWVDVIPETVGQYTGLTDKNGTKIFEGDIVWNEYQEEYGEIRYDEETAMLLVTFDSWCVDFDHYSAKKLEVVGNIHDNPELLKGVNDNG